MKVFIIAMLTGGAALLFAALFWPDRPIPAFQQKHRLAPVTAAVDQENVESAQVHETIPASLSQISPSRIPHRAAIKPGESPTVDPQLTADEQLTFKQTGTNNTSLRNVDFPRTYISKVHVDLTSPNHWVTLTWSGPNARLQVRSQYHSSPGRGFGNNNCDDPAESCRVNSNCTPKGTMHVQSFSNSMVGSPECRYVTWFDTKRGIALHYYPSVPNYPASHGCVRLDEYAAQFIHNNSKIGETEVVIDGKWTFAR